MLSIYEVCHTVGSYKGTEAKAVQLEYTFILITNIS